MPCPSPNPFSKPIMSSFRYNGDSEGQWKKKKKTNVV